MLLLSLPKPHVPVNSINIGPPLHVSSLSSSTVLKQLLKCFSLSTGGVVRRGVSTVRPLWAYSLEVEDALGSLDY